MNASQESATSTPKTSFMTENNNSQPIETSVPPSPNVEATVDKEREMAELLITMDNYKSIIPDAVIDYYLNKTGFDCDDPRIKKLFALAAQKFVADIATDAFQNNKRSRTKSNKDKKIVMSMDDLSKALTDYGVNVKKPDYYS